MEEDAVKKAKEAEEAAKKKQEEDDALDEAINEAVRENRSMDVEEVPLACCEKCDAIGPKGTQCYCTDDNRGFFVEDLPLGSKDHGKGSMAEEDGQPKKKRKNR